MRAVVLPVGVELYALTLDAATEVVPEPAIARLPHAPAGLLGVANVRGKVIAVADTGALLGLDPLGAAPFVVTARTDRGPLGLAASAQPEAVVLGDCLGPARSPYSSGLYETGEGRVVALLDPDSLAATQEAAA